MVTGDLALSNENIFSVKGWKENKILERHEDTQRDMREKGKMERIMPPGWPGVSAMKRKTKERGKNSREERSPPERMQATCAASLITLVKSEITHTHTH